MMGRHYRDDDEQTDIIAHVEWEKRTKDPDFNEPDSNEPDSNETKAITEEAVRLDDSDPKYADLVSRSSRDRWMITAAAAVVLTVFWGFLVAYLYATQKPCPTLHPRPPITITKTVPPYPYVPYVPARP